MPDSAVLAIALAAAIGAGAIFLWRVRAREAWADSWRPPSPKDGSQGSEQLEAVLRLQREKGAVASAMLDRIEKASAGLEQVEKLTKAVEVLARRVDEMGSRWDRLPAQSDGGAGRRYDKLVGETRDISGRVKVLEDDLRKMLSQPPEKSHGPDDRNRPEYVPPDPGFGQPRSAFEGPVARPQVPRIDLVARYITSSYNEDPRGFRDRFGEAKQFGVQNAEQLIKGDGEPVFGFQGSADYIFVPHPEQPDTGFAFPKARVLGPAAFKTGCMSRVFVSNYESGFRYKSLRVKSPARFDVDGDLLILKDQGMGEIELLGPEPEV